MTAEEERDMREILADPALGGIAVTAIVRLNGVVVKPIDGMFLEAVETVTPGDTERSVLRPAVVVFDTDYAGLSRLHTFEVRGVVYRQYGEAKPDGAGMTNIFLVK